MKNSVADNTSQLINDHIEKLHQRESGDFQTLLRQVQKNQRKIQLNLPQLVAALAQQPYKFLEWGRGTGKTTFFGHDFQETVIQLPRSTGLFIGPTYQAILTRIIPSLIQGLEMFGLYQNLHYFIGTRPPRSWRKSWGTAYQPPEKWDKYITFYNGAGVHLISHDVKGDGRGLSTDWIKGDEAALLAIDKLQENTDPTLRGTNKQAFAGKPRFGSKSYASSTPLEPEGAWFTDMEIQAMERPEDIAFISATCEHNLHNLMDGYLENAERNAYAKWVFDAEYKNIRPLFSKGGFYGLFDKHHCYVSNDNGHYQEVGQQQDCRGDGDLVPGLPLILGMDFGAAINSLTISQYIKSFNEHRVLRDMYVLGSDKKIQQDLIELFCDHYEYHNNKEVELWYDNTGNLSTGHTKKTRAQQVQEQMSRRGWKVRLMTKGVTNPFHDLKHLLWETILKGDLRSLPNFTLNRINAKNLRQSMINAKIKPGRNGEVKKDKSSEQSTVIPRQHATDLSDAMDAVIFGRYYDLFRYSSSMIPSGS